MRNYGLKRHNRKNKMTANNKKINFFNLSHLKKNSIKKMIFFAADEKYYNLYGKKLIKSLFFYNNKWSIHAHIYNPSRNTINELRNNKKLTYSFETLNELYFFQCYSSFMKNTDKSFQIKTLLTLKSNFKVRFSNILAKLIPFFGILVKLSPRKPLIKHFKCIYFACQRFIVLNQLLNKINKKIDILAIDADSLINKKLPNFHDYKKCDIALLKRTDATQPFLAGIMYLPHQGKRLLFIDEYSRLILKSLIGFKINWGLDQETLSNVVPKYAFKKINSKLCDLDFKKKSFIWISKGNTKHSNKFHTA